jgi:hypothetical protein
MRFSAASSEDDELRVEVVDEPVEEPWTMRLDRYIGRQLQGIQTPPGSRIIAARTSFVVFYDAHLLVA